MLAEAGVRLAVATITGVDPTHRVLLLDGDGESQLSYDALVLATGSRLAGAPFAAAPKVYDADTPDGAARLWQRLEAPHANGEPLTVAVVGGGLTGIEMATEIATENGHARVSLLDGATELAASYEPVARTEIRAALEQLGVDIRSAVRVAGLGEGAVELDGGASLDADIVVWCGGLEATPVPFAGSAPRDPLGRIVVGADLAVAGHDSLFAAGDAASAVLGGGRSAPMSCQLAIPMGKIAGRNAVADLLGEQTEPFSCGGYVTCLDLGAAGAIFTLGWERRLELSGAEAKARKRLINRSLIYPPRGRTLLLEAGMRGSGAATKIESVAG